jgi:hypothetical protein
MLPEVGLAVASKCGTWKMVELALGWQMARVPLAGSGQAADACKETQSANATTEKLILRLGRDGNFMTDGALYNRKFEDRYAMGRSNSKAKLLLSEK